jgi:hypothetical protein
MAKNNFKKKKTLKRSFRRNHTKKVASASLGSRTPNIRKKNRRSQKQRTTLRNKRNARAKVGGGFAMDALLTAIANRENGIDMTHQKLARVTAEKEEKARIWEAKVERYKRDTSYEQKLINNNYAIQPKLNHICNKMHNVENEEEEHTLFEAAEKLINPKELSKELSPKDIANARNVVLKARNIGARKRNMPDRKDWYYSYDYGGIERTPSYEHTEYDYPADVVAETKRLEKDIINNQKKLFRNSRYNDPDTDYDDD